MKTPPCVLPSIPTTMRARVVLPQPLGPSTEMNSPSPTVSETRSRTSSPTGPVAESWKNTLERSRISRAGGFVASPIGELPVDQRGIPDALEVVAHGHELVAGVATMARRPDTGLDTRDPEAGADPGALPACVFLGRLDHGRPVERSRRANGRRHDGCVGIRARRLDVGQEPELD